MFLKFSQNSQENTCARVSFLTELLASICKFITKETLARVFSGEFCEIFKKTFLRIPSGDCFWNSLLGHALGEFCEKIKFYFSRTLSVIYSTKRILVSPYLYLENLLRHYHCYISFEYSVFMSSLSICCFMLRKEWKI